MDWTMARSYQPSERERRFAEALDRIARFSEAYEGAINAKEPTKENVGSCLCVVLGRHARKTLNTA